MLSSSFFFASTRLSFIFYLISFSSKLCGLLFQPTLLSPNWGFYTVTDEYKPLVSIVDWRIALNVFIPNISAQVELMTPAVIGGISKLMSCHKAADTHTLAKNKHWRKHGVNSHPILWTHFWAMIVISTNHAEKQVVFPVYASQIKLPSTLGIKCL